jgi:hypothetical protein
MGLPKGTYGELQGVERNVVLLTRKTVDQLESFRAMREGLQAAAKLKSAPAASTR